jgi:hypothetical protein
MSSNKIKLLDPLITDPEKIFAGSVLQVALYSALFRQGINEEFGPSGHFPI